jgi:hypothetical protein
VSIKYISYIIEVVEFNYTTKVVEFFFPREKNALYIQKDIKVYMAAY